MRVIRAMHRCISSTAVGHRLWVFALAHSRLKAWFFTNGREGMDEETVIELAEEGARLGCHHCLGVLLSLPVTAPPPPLSDASTPTPREVGELITRRPQWDLQLPPLSPNVATSMCSTLPSPPSPQVQACVDEAERMLAKGQMKLLKRFSTCPCS